LRLPVFASGTDPEALLRTHRQIGVRHHADGGSADRDACGV